MRMGFVHINIENTELDTYCKFQALELNSRRGAELICIAELLWNNKPTKGPKELIRSYAIIILVYKGRVRVRMAVQGRVG